jgi:hypothetical protein
MATNKVVAGDYENMFVGQAGGKAFIILKLFKQLELNKTNIESYEVIDSEQNKSLASGIVRGAVGAVLLGGVGLLAGGLSAKNKGSYTIAVKFKDGKNSLMEVDSKIHKAIIQAMF